MVLKIRLSRVVFDIVHEYCSVTELKLFYWLFFLLNANGGIVGEDDFC